MQGGESTHGVASGCGQGSDNSSGCPTSFPTGTGLGASFDADLWREVGGVIGREARALNNQALLDTSASSSSSSSRTSSSALAAAAGAVPGLPRNGKSGLYFLDPNINLMRDPRWGRALGAENGF